MIDMPNPMQNSIQNVEDLEVYQKLFKLALDVHELTMSYSKFELYELGSQSRRASNAAPALLAEGFGNMHTNIYSEKISQSLGEIKETKHHLRMACKKNYFNQAVLDDFIKRYDECLRMLHGLDKSLRDKHRK